ncbi:hypothetical protein [Kangiella sp.]|uniref:hypothetical protein n=1 Tax=Kangiella sp. TaxID=1920245 RepID=UPI0019BE232A|nr:hypothetical protein [Kangiella sp.]MBD3652344.1 hypothetical protein [Kangiella sp.]
MNNYFLYTGISIALILNIFASYRVFRSDYFDKRQKVIQVILIWILPFIAAIGILLFLSNEEKPKGRPSEFGGGAHDSIGATADD